MIFNKRWRRIIIFISIFKLSSLDLFAGSATNDPRSWTGNITPFIGFIILNQNDWGDTATSGETGITVDIKKKSWPIGVMTELIYSEGRRFFYSTTEGYHSKPGYGDREIPIGSHGEMNLIIREAAFGFRKAWERYPVFRPFVGGGLSYSDLEGRFSYTGNTFLNKESGQSVNRGDGIGQWIDVGTMA